MGHAILESFVAGHGADIECADRLIREKVIPDSAGHGPFLVSTIAQWFIRIDVVALRDRARIIERLAQPFGPYSMIFGPDHYDNALAHWTGKGADAFADYCKGGSEGNFSLLMYCNEVHQSCIDHYRALNVGDGASGFVEVLEGAQNHFAEVFIEQIGGFEQRYEDAMNWSVSLDPFETCLQNVLNVYRAAATQAELADGASAAVADQALFLTNGSAVDLQEDLFGPTDTVPLDDLDPVEGDWTA